MIFRFQWYQGVNRYSPGREAHAHASSCHHRTRVLRRNGVEFRIQVSFPLRRQTDRWRWRAVSSISRTRSRRRRRRKDGGEYQIRLNMVQRKRRLNSQFMRPVRLVVFRLSQGAVPVLCVRLLRVMAFFFGNSLRDQDLFHQGGAFRRRRLVTNFTVHLRRHVKGVRFILSVLFRLCRYVMLLDYVLFRLVIRCLSVVRRLFRHGVGFYRSPIKRFQAFDVSVS